MKKSDYLLTDEQIKNVFASVGREDLATFNTPITKAIAKAQAEHIFSELIKRGGIYVKDGKEIECPVEDCDKDGKVPYYGEWGEYRGRQKCLLCHGTRKVLVDIPFSEAIKEE